MLVCGAKSRHCVSVACMEDSSWTSTSVFCFMASLKDLFFNALVPVYICFSCLGCNVLPLLISLRMPYFSVYFHLRWHHWNLFRDRSFYSLLSPRLSVPFFELLVPYFVLWLSFILVFPHLRLWALRDVRESKFTKTFIVLNAEPGNIATKQNTA